jgi:hypothetical protein
METRHARAPSYQTLRPLKGTVTSTFPVYRGLADRLAAEHGFPDATAAHVLATCAGYAYSDEGTVSMIMARLGLEANRCLRVAQSVDAMFICSTAYLVQSRCGRVAILCYRGTEPMNFVNWLTDADVNPERIAYDVPGVGGPAFVHAGFYRNVRATRFALIAALQRALDREPLVEGEPPPEHALQALYVTGHSLGGAMAAMMGLMLARQPLYARIARALRGVYTFGQPMIATPELAHACDALPGVGGKLVRYVHGHDVVPALPPTASGPFAHHGTEYRLVRRGPGEVRVEPAAEPTKQLPSLLHLAGAPLAFLAQQVQLLRGIAFPYSLADHGPQHYIAGLTPPDVRSEFGD